MGGSQLKSLPNLCCAIYGDHCEVWEVVRLEPDRKLDVKAQYQRLAPVRGISGRAQGEQVAFQAAKRGSIPRARSSAVLAQGERPVVNGKV